jgi:hypothetical protein
VGNTNKNAAYRRDSGATAQMTPDDIARHAVWRNRPKLALNIVAVDNGSPPVEIRDISLRRLIRSDEYADTLASKFSIPPDKQAALEALLKVGGAYKGLFAEDGEKKRDVMLKRFAYMREMALLQKVHVVVLNTGKCLASQCNVHLVIPNPGGTVLFETEDTLPQEPPTWSPGGATFQMFRIQGSGTSTNLRRMTAENGEYVIALPLGNIQAGNRSVSESFYIGASAAQNLTVRYTIFYDEPGGPQSGEIQLAMEIEDTLVSYGEILQTTHTKRSQ